MWRGERVEKAVEHRRNDDALDMKSYMQSIDERGKDGQAKRPNL